jgi:hypothetical protein
MVYVLLPRAYETSIPAEFGETCPFRGWIPGR